MSTPPISQPILRFPGHEHPDLPMQPGMNGLCRDPDHDRALMITPGGGSSLIEFCSDARGLWLHVAAAVRSVYVNGRPVQRLACLHVGDSIHCEGVEMQLVDAAPRAAARAMEAASSTPSRLLLRGHGGDVHGQSVALEQPLSIGGPAGLRVTGVDTAIGELLPQGADGVQLRLEDTAADCRLNGWPVQQAWLRAGDQLLLAPGCRYLVESPGDAPAPPPRNGGAATAAPPVLESPRRLRVPWLLLAAALIALLLAALLWFGVK